MRVSIGNSGHAWRAGVDWTTKHEKMHWNVCNMPTEPGSARTGARKSMKMRLRVAGAAFCRRTSLPQLLSAVRPKTALDADFGS